MNSGIKVDLTKSVNNWPIHTLIKRGLWKFLISPVTRALPVSLNKIRILILRACGASIGHNCYILPGVKILLPWELTLHDFVVIGESAEIYNHARIEIHSMTVISQRAFLCTSGHDYTDPHMPLTAKPIVIGSECWIAAEAFVGPGVTVRDGTIIGARAVITRNTEAWTVYAGNPAKAIKPRVLLAAKGQTASTP